MNTKQILRSLVIFTVLALTIGCDQISKNIVRQEIAYHEEISLIDNFLILTKIENRGAFLSVGHSLPEPIKMLLLTVLPIVVLTFAVLYLLTKKSLPTITVLGISFVVGGGIGNIYDRVIYGSVTDFLHIDFVIFQTGIFNMADVSILSGILMIVFDLYYKGPGLTDFTWDKD